MPWKRLGVSLDAINGKQVNSCEVNKFYSILDNRIRAVYEDQKGQILIGTAKSGLHVYMVRATSVRS